MSQILINGKTVPLRDYVDKYYWIYYHPKLNNPKTKTPSIFISPQHKNPATNNVEDDLSLNTAIWFFAELSYNDGLMDIPHCETSHDMNCDVVGNTYEDVVENLYQRVKELFGDYIYDLQNP